VCLRKGFLRIIFGPKRVDVTGEWKKLHAELRSFIIFIHPQILLGR
jgi:hypothetical protein